MNKIFENAKFGDCFKTRDGRKAIFSRKDGDTFDLETEESYNPVRADGSFLYTKEGYESSCDIVSEWYEPIDEEELDKLANAHCEELEELGCRFNEQERLIVIDTYKVSYRKAKRE